MKFPSPASRCLVIWAGLILFLVVHETLSCSVFGQDKPNIILVNLDDADAELFELRNSERLFPNIMGMGRDGVTFNNFHVTTPLCGPSRACLYRGQYAHNTGFRVNQGNLRAAHHFEGGFKFYRERGYFKNDLSTWMQDAGYRTMLVGKFLHHDFERYVPPGWDDYYVYRGARYYGTPTFKNRDSARGLSGRIPDGVYRTTAETSDAIELIANHVARDDGRPFFLNVNPIGPHRAQPNHPEMIDRRMQNWWTRIRPPRTPEYDESDNRDKRGVFASQDRLTDAMHRESKKHFRERVLATRSVDNMVGGILETLSDLGIEDNTYVFVTSDNGFLLGHFRVFGKGVPADRTTRVPLFVKGPGVPRGQVANHLIGHIDLAPTFVELAKGKTPAWVDGISFANLLTTNGLQQTRVFRNALLIENWFDMNNMGNATPAASNALRLPDAMYTEWANGDKDFFDLSQDPHQLTNRYDELDQIDQLVLEVWLESLKNPSQLAKARFTVPFVRGEAVAHGGELFGLAEDPVGVARVRIQIHHSPTNKYWNGSSWQTTPLLIDADLDGPNHQLTFWRYSLPNEMSQNVDGNVSVWAWAYDREGNFNWPTNAVFQFDNENPIVELNEPMPGARSRGQTMIRGTASDNLEVAEVNILIRDLGSNQYWDGDAFQSRRVSVTVQPRWNDSWEYSANLPAGQYGIRVNAIDTSGNVSDGTTGRRFFVEE